MHLWEENLRLLILSGYIFIWLYLSIYLSIYISIYLSIYLSVLGSDDDDMKEFEPNAVVSEQNQVHSDYLY